jgi:predicted naringenin-chalcone synthase
MAERAALSALQSWGGSLSDITHIILGTMSAVIDAPTFDARLINSLRLPSNVRRLAVQQMGCLTGFRCLSTAAELAAANPGARVLVVVADVRSGLQNQLPRWDPQEGPSRACIISCALFRDAASAVVVGAGPRPHEAPSARILKTASAFLPDTLEYVAIKDLDDETISWHNSKHLPDAVSQRKRGEGVRLRPGACLVLQNWWCDECSRVSSQHVAPGCDTARLAGVADSVCS